MAGTGQASSAHDVPEPGARRGGQIGDGPAPTKGARSRLFCLTGPGGTLSSIDAGFARLLEIPTGDLDGTSLLDLAHPEDAPALTQALALLACGAVEARGRTRLRRGDGQWIPLDWAARAIPGSRAWQAVGYRIVPADPLSRPAFPTVPAEEPPATTAAITTAAITTAAMWQMDLVSEQMIWEPHAAAVLAVAPVDLPPSQARLLAAAHPEDTAALRQGFQQLRLVGHFEVTARLGWSADARQVAIRGTTLGGGPVVGGTGHAIGIVVDISTDKALEQQMLRMVLRDALTGAPNRKAFDQSLRAECRRSSRSLEPLSVLMIDIDGFKVFNQAFGHLIGDDALCSLARTLAAAVNREGDLLARFGGEEFAMVLPGADSVGALAVARRLVEAARSVVIRQAPGSRLSVSVGTASWEPDGTPPKPETLLTRSDQALQVAKAEGKNRAIAYERSIAGREALKAAIAHGLEAEEFELYYQPVVDLLTDEVVGFEALMRWNRPGHGMVAPDDFIPIAETSTVICDLGRWALSRAARQLASWISRGLDENGRLRMAVNASARHVSSPAILDDVAAALADSGLPPQRLEVELTETALADSGLTAKHLALVRELGVTVAIDDFGTGYTSIGQLSQLPVDTLKIDRSFVASAHPRQQALMQLMIGAARAFDLTVVAEGVEDATTLASVRALGCDRVQGYYLSRPLPAERIPAWLAAWRSGEPPRAVPNPGAIVSPA